MGVILICVSTSLWCPLPTAVIWLPTRNHRSYAPEDMGQPSVPTKMPTPREPQLQRLLGHQPPKGNLFIKNFASFGFTSEMGNSCQSLQLQSSIPQPHISPSLPCPVEESHSQNVNDETKAWKRVGKLLVSFISTHNIFPHKVIIKQSVSTFYLLPIHQRIQLPAVPETPYRNDSQLESGWHGLPDILEFGKRVLSMGSERGRTKTSLRWFWYAPWNENHFYRRLLDAITIGPTLLHDALNRICE